MRNNLGKGSNIHYPASHMEVRVLDFHCAYHSLTVCLLIGIITQISELYLYNPHS